LLTNRNLNNAQDYLYFRAEILTVVGLNEKITIPQYHDWWFDNAVEFLGRLLGR